MSPSKSIRKNHNARLSAVSSPHPQDRLEQLAEKLPSVAQMPAGSLLTSPLQKSDKLTSVIGDRGEEPWYFFATAAVVYRALMSLKRAVSPQRFEYLARIPFDQSRRNRSNRSGSDAYLRVAKVVDGWTDGWYRDGERAVADCSEFIDRALRASKQGAEEASVSEIGAGLWVLWNVYGERPPRSDPEMLGMIGFALFSVAANYWNTA